MGLYHVADMCQGLSNPLHSHSQLHLVVGSMATPMMFISIADTPWPPHYDCICRKSSYVGKRTQSRCPQVSAASICKWVELDNENNCSFLSDGAFNSKNPSADVIVSKEYIYSFVILRGYSDR